VTQERKEDGTRRNSPRFADPSRAIFDSEAHVVNWFEAARERFSGPGEFPLIDDKKIVEGEAVYEYWPWCDGWKRKRNAEALREAALTADHFDPPVRFVYLNLFYRLAHYSAERVSQDVEDQDGADIHREQFGRDLQALVGLVDVQQCKDAREVRWEIVNACAIRDWKRAERLYARLEELAEGGIAHVLAIRARFEFLAVFAQRWELDLDLWAWSPTPTRGEPILRLFLCGGAVRDDPAPALSPDELNRVEDAAHHLTKAVRDEPGLDIIYQFLLLRCHLALSRFRDASADCEILLRRRSEFPGQSTRDFDFERHYASRLYALAVDAYESDGEIERAISTSDRWMREFPDQPGIHERRSRLFRMQGDFTPAYEELRKEVDKNPLRGKDPAVEMALAFGNLYQDQETQWETFKRGVDARDEELVRVVLRVHWPQLERLAERNIKDWVDACYLLLCRKPNNPPMAMNTLARLVENELRTRVFGRFRKELGTEEISSMRVGTDPLAKYLSGDDRIALGQMLNEIRFPDARTAAGLRFRQWLRDENLLPRLQDIDLGRLYNLHIPGKHTKETYTPSWEDAEELAKLSRGVLSIILQG
jgi:tetratricopeptide (TPR) repeat protein